LCVRALLIQIIVLFTVVFSTLQPHAKATFGRIGSFLKIVGLYVISLEVPFHGMDFRSDRALVPQFCVFSAGPKRITRCLVLVLQRFYIA